MGLCCAYALYFYTLLLLLVLLLLGRPDGTIIQAAPPASIRPCRVSRGRVSNSYVIYSHVPRGRALPRGREKCVWASGFGHIGVVVVVAVGVGILARA